MSTRARPRHGLTRDPRWYQHAVIYEIPVRAYADSNGDGIGDFPGLISKLDFLQNLGVDALWLLPFYPSPMRDGGYDIADYTSVHPMYGSLDDFKRLLDEAHARGMRIITELVINHTSRDHPWFERARRAPAGSPERDFYVWSETTERYADARIIFKDFESSNWSFDPVARANYWHRFYSHQPDLNFENPAVQAALFEVLDFWLSMGVDGLRLDAVPYLYEREGTSCENLDETHAFLKKLRKHIDDRYQDRMLLAEANQWPEDAAAYFGDGDECHMNFHFPLMPRLFMALQLEDRFPIIDILKQTPAIPAGCQWATFLRNHDELTLEMVTDQDRDYMYQVYAEDPTARLNLGIRRRLAPLLKARQKIELINSLLFSLPGTPVLYYGDEIGMGDNIYLSDRDGVRTPMQWTADRNAGFSRANPQKLYLPAVTDPEYHFEAVNVEAQEQNPNSLLWFTRRLIAVARKNHVLGEGNIEFLHPQTNKVLAYLRTRGDHRVLCVANLSRFPQYVQLDLSAFEGQVPVELFSNVRFPAIGKTEYLLTLTPHAFFWFRLEQPRGLPMVSSDVQLDARGAGWREYAEADADGAVLGALITWVSQQRWFRGKARVVKEASIIERVPLGADETSTVVTLLQVEYTEGLPETYCVPLAFFPADHAALREQATPQALISRVRSTSLGDGALFDTFASGDAVWPLLQAAGAEGQHGRLLASTEGALAEAVRAEVKPPCRPTALEQTNTVVFIGETAIVKMYRQLEDGLSPELEMGSALTQRLQGKRLVPQVLGSVTYSRAGKKPSSVAIAHELVVNEGDAWKLARAEVELFFERVLSQGNTPAPPLPQAKGLTAQTREAVPPVLAELGGRFFALARRLGQRTAEVHLLLGQPTSDPAFAPEPFTVQHQQSIYQWSHVNIARTFELLRWREASLPDDVKKLLEAVLPAEKKLDALMRRVVGRRMDLLRARVHGDLHLGQVLFTGDDFVIIDFEGEPARPINERRFKRGVLRDAMGMVRSFDYATEAVLRNGRIQPQAAETLRPWAEAWARWVSLSFLRSYLDTMDGSALVPKSDELKDLLFEFYEAEKIVYEVEYELNNRPDWLRIPLTALERFLRETRE